MLPRENLLRAIRRDKPEHVPFYFSLCPDLLSKFTEITGKTDYMDYFGMPLRHVKLLPTERPMDYSAYYDELPEGAAIDEWGVAHIPGINHFSRMLHPMENFNSPDQVWEFPVPDVMEAYRWKNVEKEIGEIRSAGFAAVYSAIQVFEPAWYLRGLDNLLADMICDEPMAKACLDRMADIKSQMAAGFAQAGIDMIIYGDDVGTQKDMMMSPELWRKWLKPIVNKTIRAAKEINPDIVAYYHSDGVIDAIIPDLIEVGVDVLNPVQPECMDPVKLKEMYGDRLSFWGAVGTQTTMPFGSPGEVEKMVKKMLETVGKGGGFVIAPTHLLEPEVPWENVEAFVRAVRKYGRY